MSPSLSPVRARVLEVVPTILPRRAPTRQLDPAVQSIDDVRMGLVRLPR